MIDAECELRKRAICGKGAERGVPRLRQTVPVERFDLNPLVLGDMDVIIKQKRAVQALRIRQGGHREGEYENPADGLHC